MVKQLLFERLIRKFVEHNVRLWSFFLPLPLEAISPDTPSCFKKVYVLGDKPRTRRASDSSSKAQALKRKKVARYKLGLSGHLVVLNGKQDLSSIL